MPPPPFEAKEPVPTVPSDDPAVDRCTAGILASFCQKHQHWRKERRRVHGKDGPFSLWRPAALQQDDVVSMLKEVMLG